MENKIGFALIISYIVLIWFFPFNLIPFCFGDCYDKKHVCPNCKVKVGVKRACLDWNKKDKLKMIERSNFINLIRL